MPVWLMFLSEGLVIFATLAMAAVVASRAGKSPYFALLLMAPLVNVAAIWLFAFSPWPKAGKKA